MTTKPREMDVKVTLEPESMYCYTWPGQEPKIVTGAELTELCKGADASQLSIELCTMDVAVDVPPMSLKETDALLSEHIYGKKDKP